VVEAGGREPGAQPAAEEGVGRVPRAGQAVALERTPQQAADDPSRLSGSWTAAHAAYHHTLLAGCPNPRLLAVADSLRDAAELYRQWSVPLAHAHRDIAGERRAILDAVLARDVDAAAAALAAHIHATTNVLLDQADAPVDDTETA
jgi:DNA-binding GntR family transcriptional regulator